MAGRQSHRALEQLRVQRQQQQQQKQRQQQQLPCGCSRSSSPAAKSAPSADVMDICVEPWMGRLGATARSRATAPTSCTMAASTPARASSRASRSSWGSSSSNTCPTAAAAARTQVYHTCLGADYPASAVQLGACSGSACAACCPPPPHSPQCSSLLTRMLTATYPLTPRECKYLITSSKSSGSKFAALWWASKRADAAQRWVQGGGPHWCA
jgi:hypothetical protein